jgi:hypothetical protein
MAGICIADRPYFDCHLLAGNADGLGGKLDVLLPAEASSFDFRS